MFWSLPEGLTPSEKRVADIAFDIARNRDDKTVSLSEIVDEFLKSNTEDRKHVRSTVNHFIGQVILKLMVAAKDDRAWVLYRHPKIGRGAKAEFQWMQKGDIEDIPAETEESVE